MLNKIKIRILAIALAAIVVTLCTQSTLAYYSVIGKASNVITSGEISLAIHKKTKDGSDFPKEGVYIKPGDIVSKIVTVENVCTHPFYLRVKLTNGINDDALSAEDVYGIDINEEYWTQQGEYYYYNTVVAPGEETQRLFSEVRIIGEKVDNRHLGKTFTLMVDAYGVQSENNPADYPWEAKGWPADLAHTGGNG